MYIRLEANERAHPNTIFKGVQKLESFAILNVPDEVVFKVARTVAVAQKM